VGRHEIKKIASTASAHRTLFDTDAARSYPALANSRRRHAAFAVSSVGGGLADASANLFDAAVNRKVDGTFTDLTH
jgi:hypothetical protein